MSDQAKTTTPRKSSQQSRMLPVLLLLVLGPVVLFVAWYFAGPPATPENTRHHDDPQQMVAGLRTWLAQHPEDSFARFNLAKLLIQSDTEAALAELQKIPAGATEYFDALNYMTGISLQLGKPELAKQALKQLEEHQPDDPNLQAQLTEFFYNQQKYEQALLHAVRRAELQPERIDAHIRVAEINADLNRHVDMIPPLKKVIKLDPEHYRAHINLAHACYRTGQLQIAEAEANWCLKRNPNEAFCYRILAQIERDKGRISAAEQHLRTALKLAPNDLETRILEANLLLYQKQAEQAYHRLKPLYTEHKSQGKFLGVFARAAAASGRTSEAQQLYEELKHIP